MRWWETTGSVLAGTVVTALFGGLALLSLPLLGFAAAEVAGNGLPVWVFAGPVVVAVLAGGATTGFFQGRDWRRGAVLGGLAAALGVTILGGALGFVAFVLVAGMTPAHAGTVQWVPGSLTLMGLGGLLGFLAGVLLGAGGGVAGQQVRQRRSSSGRT